MRMALRFLASLKSGFITTASLDGSFKIVRYKSVKANLRLNFDQSEYDIEHVRKFDEAITYSFDNEHR